MVICKTTDSDRVVGTEVRWAEKELRAVVGDRVFAVPHVRTKDGIRDDEATFASLEKALNAGGYSAKACGSCIWFRSSSLAQQFSGRRAGYCSLVGFRRRCAIVQISFNCGEHERVGGWPDDCEIAWRMRLERSDSVPRPSRENAFEGALLGYLMSGSNPSGETWADFLEFAGCIVSKTHDSRSELAKSLASLIDRKEATGSENGRGWEWPFLLGLALWRDKGAMKTVCKEVCEMSLYGNAQQSSVVAELAADAMQKQSAAQMHEVIRDLHLIPDDSLTTQLRTILAELAKGASDFATALLAVEAISSVSHDAKRVSLGLAGAFNGCTGIPEQFQKRLAPDVRSRIAKIARSVSCHVE